MVSRLGKQTITGEISILIDFLKCYAWSQTELKLINIYYRPKYNDLFSTDLPTPPQELDVTQVSEFSFSLTSF